MFSAARARRGYLSPGTAPAYRRLQEDAAAMIELARDEPSADIRALEEQQTHRRIALKIAAPEPAQGIIGRVRDRLTRRQPPTFHSPSQEPPHHDPPSFGR